jgi:hypothetical protein
MNRIVVLGVAIFFALVGIALVGGEQTAEAGLFNWGGGGGYGCAGDCGGGCRGRRCHGGCDGCHGGGCCSSGKYDGCNGCSGSCHGRHRCHGRDRCSGRCFGRHRCNGGCNGCGGCGGGYGGGKAVQAPVQK